MQTVLYQTTLRLKNEDIKIFTNFEKSESSFTNLQDLILPVRRLSDNGRVHPSINSASGYRYPSFDSDYFSNKNKCAKKPFIAGILVLVILIIIIVIVVPVVITQQQSMSSLFFKFIFLS